VRAILGYVGAQLARVGLRQHKAPPAPDVDPAEVGPLRRIVNVPAGRALWVDRKGVVRRAQRITRRYSWLPRIAFNEYRQAQDEAGVDVAPEETRRARNAAKARRRGLP
jgi:hypothetical protein